MKKWRFIGLIVVLILFTSTTTYAVTTLYDAIEVGYDNSNSGTEEIDIQGAIDELYTLANRSIGPIGTIVDDLLASSETYTYMDGTYLKNTQDNNYIWLSGNLYRIMGKDENGNVRLISEGNITIISYDDTSNVFETSHAYEWLNDYFYRHLESSLQNQLQMTSYCKDVTDDSSSARTTCTSEGNAMIILMSLDEFNLAGSNSYLRDSEIDVWYTLTPNTSTTRGWSGRANTNATTFSVIGAGGIRPIITISSDVIMESGSGTKTDPYQIEKSKGSIILRNIATSGEYVKLDGKLYRVMEKTMEGTKMVLDGYVSEAMNYRNMLTSLQDGSVLNELVSAANQAKVAAITWNHGRSFDYGKHYSIALDDTGTDIFSSKVGTIRIGEMYAAPSDSVSGSDRMTYSWTLTKVNASYSWYVIRDSTTDYNSVSSTYGIRPVLVISPTVTIKGGNGTYHSPYEI